MAGSGYEIFALLMRYVFVALGALILLRAFLWLRKDARMYRKEIKNLPDAGLVGELVDMATGQRYPLSREGVLGSGRSCDVRIRGAMVERKALRFLFVEGKGLAVTSSGRQAVYLDGEALYGTGCALHGTQMEVGGVTLRVRLFAGLKVPRRVLYDEDGMQLMDNEPSPFEEVAGMFGQDFDAPENMYTPDDAQENPFMDYMPAPQAYEQPVYPPARQETSPEQSDGAPDESVEQMYPQSPENETADPWAEQQMQPPQEKTVRRRRSDRYL